MADLFIRMNYNRKAYKKLNKFVLKKGLRKGKSQWSGACKKWFEDGSQYHHLKV